MTPLHTRLLRGLACILAGVTVCAVLGWQMLAGAAHEAEIAERHGVRAVADGRR